MTSSSSQRNMNQPTKIASFVYDNRNKKSYKTDAFLGKGGFAHCYLVYEQDTRQEFAAKVVAKLKLKEHRQKEKMVQEIKIHRSLHHENVVDFHDSFEDNQNIYVILEYCSRRSLMELHKRRNRISEPEVRFFSKDIAVGCAYLHDQKVIHRDLKLGNVFLDENLRCKIGDFGLATNLDFAGEKKQTMCGTPNYIAPEVLDKRGHSYEVDVWSLGCIIFTLLIGRPPFETKSLKDTYKRIRSGSYDVPNWVTYYTRALINKLLAMDPNKRPSMKEVLDDEFYSYFTPPELPVSSLTTTPHFDNIDDRRPLSAINFKEEGPVSCNGKIVPFTPNTDKTARDHLQDLLKHVNLLLDDYNKLKAQMTNRYEEALDPASIPIYWVSKWVDYSDKYGLGYQLCDNSVGVLFNDYTRMVCAANEINLQSIDREGKESFFTTTVHPDREKKKIQLVVHFRDYMNDYLIKAGERVAKKAEECARLPYLCSWFRTNNAIILFLSNGTFQINFFGDHTKMILCPLMMALTYSDKERNFSTYSFKKMRKHGIDKDILERLNYSKHMIEILLGFRDQASGGKTAGAIDIAQGAPQSKPMVENNLNKPATSHKASPLC